MDETLVVVSSAVDCRIGAVSATLVSTQQCQSVKIDYVLLHHVDTIYRQCRREGAWKPVQITGTRRSGWGPGARLCCICFCLSRYYHYLSIVQINPFSPSPSQSGTVSKSFRFSVKIFSWSALSGWPEINVFKGGPNLLSAALCTDVIIICSSEARLCLIILWHQMGPTCWQIRLENRWHDKWQG